MRDWILRLYAALALYAKDSARRTWDELPGQVTAAVLVEAALTGDPVWITAAVLLLATLAVLRR